MYLEGEMFTRRGDEGPIQGTRYINTNIPRCKEKHTNCSNIIIDVDKFMNLLLHGWSLEELRREFALYDVEQTKQVGIEILRRLKNV